LAKPWIHAHQMFHAPRRWCQNLVETRKGRLRLRLRLRLRGAETGLAPLGGSGSYPRRLGKPVRPVGDRLLIVLVIVIVISPSPRNPEITSKTKPKASLLLALFAVFAPPRDPLSAFPLLIVILISAVPFPPPANQTGHSQTQNGFLPNPLKAASRLCVGPRRLSCYGSGYGRLRVILRVECTKSPVFTEVLTGLRVK